MDWLCLLLDMWGSNQLRSVFEEGVLAHQPVDGALVVGIRIFSEASPFFATQRFSSVDALALFQQPGVDGRRKSRTRNLKLIHF